MKLKTYLYTAALIVTFSACDGWIDEASTPNDSLTFNQLSKPGMIASVRNKVIVDGPLIATIKTLRGEAASAFFLAAAAITDEVMPSKMPNVLLYKQLYYDNITSNSAQADGIWNTLHNLRARSEELLVIQDKIAHSDFENLDAIKSYARYIGNLNAGYAYQLLAQSFSSNVSEKGGVWVNGTLMSHDDMYNQALSYYKAALKEAETDNEELKKIIPAFGDGSATREIKALKVKLYMHLGQYNLAAQQIDKALKEKEKVVIIYNSGGAENGLFTVLGINALNAQVDSTILPMLANNAEKKAIPTKRNKENNLYLSSLERYSSLVITDYNEMQLINAELIIRGHKSGDALACVNNVIASYDAASVETIIPNMEKLTHFRYVYLFLRGERLADYRRQMVSGEKAAKWNERKNKWMPFPEIEQ